MLWTSAPAAKLAVLPALITCDALSELEPMNAAAVAVVTWFQMPKCVMVPQLLGVAVGNVTVPLLLVTEGFAAVGAPKVTAWRA